MKICKSCNTNNFDEAVFCQNCGMRFGEVSNSGGITVGHKIILSNYLKTHQGKKVIITLIVFFLFIIGSVSGVYYFVSPSRIDYTAVIPDIDVKEIQALHFKNPYLKDVVVLGNVRGNAPLKEKKYAGILSFNYKKLVWEVVYEQRYGGYTALKVAIADLLPGKVDQVIISTVEGSGSFLSYSIIGWDDTQVKTLLKQIGIFQGSIQIQGNQLIQKSGHQGTIYQWNGSSFISTPMAAENQPPLSVGDVQVDFRIEANKNLWISNAAVILPKNKKLYLVRTNTGVSERVLVGSTGILEYKDGAYVGVNAGVADITIIPGGYDWPYAKHIKVNVTE